MQNDSQAPVIPVLAAAAALALGTAALARGLSSKDGVEEGFIDSPQSYYLEDRTFMNQMDADLRDAGLAHTMDHMEQAPPAGQEKMDYRILQSASQPGKVGGDTPLMNSPYAQLTGALPEGTAEKFTSGPYEDADFYSRSDFHALIPPRYYGGDYNAEVRGALPPPAMLAEPRGPMDLEPTRYTPDQKDYGTHSYGAQGLSAPVAAGQKAPKGILKGRPNYDREKRVRFAMQEGYNGSQGQTMQEYEREEAAARTAGRMEYVSNPNYAPPLQSHGGKVDFRQLATGKGTQSAGGLSEQQANVDIYAKYLNPLDYTNPQDVLPSEDMSSVAYGKLPSDPNTYVYDRLIVANQRRRNLEGADWIRGDLPIAPDNRNWFQVSVKPHLDLRQGAVTWQIGPDYDTMVEGRDLAVSAARSDYDVKVQRFA